MSAPIDLREDFAAETLRRMATGVKDANQARRFRVVWGAGVSHIVRSSQQHELRRVVMKECGLIGAYDVHVASTPTAPCIRAPSRMVRLGRAKT